MFARGSISKSNGTFWVRRADKQTAVDTLWVMCERTCSVSTTEWRLFVSVSALHQLQVHLWESESRSTGSMSQQLPASSRPRHRRHLGGFAHRLPHAQPHVHDGAPVRCRDTATQMICRMLPTWWCDTEQTLSFHFHRVSFCDVSTRRTTCNREICNEITYVDQNMIWAFSVTRVQFCVCLETLQTAVKQSSFSFLPFQIRCLWREVVCYRDSVFTDESFR